MSGYGTTTMPAQSSEKSQARWTKLSPADLSKIEVNAVATQGTNPSQMLLYPAPATSPTSADQPIPTQPEPHEAPSQSGIYTVEWSTAGILNRAITTVSAPPEPASKAIVVVPDYTWAAYCRSYGGNLYRDTPAKGIHSLRPTCADEGSIHHPGLNPISYIRERFGEVDVVAQSRISRDSSYNLRKWQTVILFGHDEYWTNRLRRQLVKAVKSGSGLLSMSGNTGYRFLRDNGKRMWRGGSWGAKRGNQLASLLGGKFRWAGYDLTRTEEIGVQWNAATKKKLEGVGWPATGYPPKQVSTATGIRVTRPQDPLLRGTGLERGDWIPGANRVESDGFPVRGKSPKSLANVRSMKLIGEAWNWIGSWGNTTVGKSARGRFTRSAVIRHHRYGQGRVVSLSSIGWMLQFETGDQTVRQITDNALRLVSR